jgi:hypothetical protein
VGIGDLKGRVIVTNGASSTLRQVKGDLDAVAASAQKINFGTLNQRLANASQSMRLAAQRLEQRFAGANHSVQGLGANVRGVIDQTKDFNEAKFGYGFATITDHIKEGRLQLDGWKKNMNAVAQDALTQARAFSTLPQVTMKAREEVEKLGFKGDDSRSLFGAAMGLHLTEPGALTSGNAAKFLGAAFRAYEKQMLEDAEAQGVDAADPAFRDKYLKGMAAKAAVAGAESALGPADIVEGMRQFAPQWAAMGISYDMALAALAHGANYGFRAPELGTAFKSMANKVIRPTGDGLGVYHRLGIDRSQYMTEAPVAPNKAVQNLNALLGGNLYTGKGGKEFKLQMREMLETGYKQGIIGTPEFQAAMSQEVQRRMGPAWAGRIAEIQQGVANSTITGQGGVKMFDLIKAMRDRGATTGDIATAFEGRHIARYTPLFQFYEKLIGMAEKIQKVDGSVLDATVKGRSESEAGKTDRMMGSWQELMVKMEQSGGVIDRVKDAIIGLNTALAALPTDALTALTASVVALAGVAAIGAVARGVPAAAGVARGAWTLSGVPWAAGAIGGTAVAGAALARNAFLSRYGVTLPTTATGWFPPAGAAAGPAAAAQASRLAMLGRVAMRTMPWLFAGYVGYQGYQGYQRDGIKGALGNMWDTVNPLNILGIGSAQAGTVLPRAILGADRRQAAEDEQGLLLAQQMQRAFAEVDLQSDGRRMMQGAEAGVREGTAALVSAMLDAAAQIRSAAANTSPGPRPNGPLTVPLNTGPSMTGFP